MAYTEVHKTEDRTWEGTRVEPGFGPMRFSADPTLFLIREAWGAGVDFEDEADGFGEGFGTQGDWSAIRDSSPGAIDAMLTKTLNWLEGVAR